MSDPTDVLRRRAQVYRAHLSAEARLICQLADELAKKQQGIDDLSSLVDALGAENEDLLQRLDEAGGLEDS